MSPVTCHLSSALPSFQTVLVKTALMLKPLEATKPNQKNIVQVAAAGGVVINTMIILLNNLNKKHKKNIPLILALV